MCFLGALGAVSLLEERFAVGASIALKAILATYASAPTMQAGIDLMEDLLRAMFSTLGSSDLELAAVIKRGRDALGRSPTEWTGIVQRATRPLRGSER